METLLHQALSYSPLLFVLVLPAAVLFILFRIQRHGALAQRNSLLGWFSSLHTFSQELDRSSDPKEMADAALAGTLRAYGATDGVVILKQEAAGESNHISSKGLSTHALEVVSAEPMRMFLASAAERWGPSLVVSDLRRTATLDEGQRGSLLRDLIAALKAEGWRSLIIIALGTRGRAYGALLVGRRKRAAFGLEEVQLAGAIGNQVSVAFDNRSLVLAGVRHDEALRTLDRVGRAMRETFDLRGQVATLSRNMRDLLEGCEFSLAMQDSPEGRLETVVPFARYSDAGATAEMAASPMEEEVARTHTPRLIVEDWQWAKYPADVSADTPRMRTWCGVPIHFSDGSVGVLSVANFEREQAITVQQLELIQVLAYEAAGAFENTRAFQREQRRASRLALLNEIGRKATSVLNPTELLANICTQVRNAFGYDLARIEVLDRRTDELVVEAEAGYGNELVGRRTLLGLGLSGAAAEQRQPVVVNSRLHDSQYTALASDVHSSVSLPLEYQDELLGVLTLESHREHAFSDQDVVMLKTLADQLSIALHNARAFQNALEESITDGLTGLKTHRYFMEELERELRHAQRSGRTFSVIMMDLDQFKPVNDQNGHLEGDRVLSEVAQRLMDQVRQSCVLARYGGDEFSILMPEATVEQAQTLAERLREAIEKDPFLAAYHVTASFGIGAYPEHGSTHEEILHVADAGMYLAKHENGNRVRVATLIPDSGQVEAYLGVEFKRKFSTGPETFNKVLRRMENAIKADGDVPLVDTVTSLARAIDLSDHYTRDHSQAVSRLAAQIARQMGLSEQELAEIRRAGILHDIGKIGVPDHILYKPAALTSEEYAIMKSHSVKGQEILEPLKVPAIQRIGRMVRHHHEMFNGGGYPDQLRGDEIPLGARILTVADCFDTMISQRAYKKARTFDEAIAELLRCSGAHFDPDLVQAFLMSLEVYGDPRSNTSLDGEDSLVIEPVMR